MLGLESMEVVAENPPLVSAKVDQESQVDFYSNSEMNSQTFIGSRYAKYDQCHAEIQIEIVEHTKSIKIHSNNKIFVDTECGTPQKSFVDEESYEDNKHFTSKEDIL